MKIITSLTALALACATASASSITLSTSPTGNRVYLQTQSAATAAPNGSKVLIGVLDTPGNFSTFRLFGTVPAGLGTIGFSGQLSGKADHAGSVTFPDNYASFFNGKAITMLIHTGADLASATHAGAFTASGPSSALYPASFTGLASQNQNIAVNNQTTIWTPVAITNFEAAARDGSPDEAGVSATGNAFILGAAIPEPSAVALLALVGLLGLRRRR